MAVLPADLTSPTGRLKLAYFPADDSTAFDTRLTAYIAAALAQSTADGIPISASDAAVKVLAQALGFREAWTDRLDRPSAANLTDEGGMSFSAAQLAGWLTQAQELEAIYAGMVESATAVGSASGWRSITSLR